MIDPNNPWPGVALRIALTIALGALAGLVLGRIFLGILLATLVYLSWHLNYLFRLDRWVRRGGVRRPPEARGIWGDVFDGLYRFQNRHRRRRQRLAQVVASFRASADAMPDATVVLRQNGEMDWWNAAAKRLLGLRWPQDQGQRVANLLRHPDFFAYLKSKRPADPILLPSPVAAGITLEVRLVPYGDGLQLLLVRDVTRLQRLESMRRDFVANISHELRTPLTVIRGLAETLAEDEATQDPQQARAVALIQQQTVRMARLVDDLLLLSRLETEGAPPRQEVVDVAALLENVVDEARALSGERHLIELDAEPALRLRGDEAELRSAFSNIVANAVKYTPAGGRIALRWGREADGARLEVKDTGIGIAPLHLPRLTERFYRVDSGRSAKTGGTGLGLAIVKHVLNRHQAKLLIDSRPGVGSTFVCEFPPARVTANSE